MNNINFKGDANMTRIKLFGVRNEDKAFIEAWSNKHKVEVDLDEDLLTCETV